MRGCNLLSAKVGRRLGWRSLWRYVGFGHATIDNEVRAVDEAALVASKEQHSLRLLDGLAEAAGWEVYLTSMALGCVVTEPILKKRCALE